MTVSWLISAELPDGERAGELTRALAGYAERLFPFQVPAAGNVSVMLLGPDSVVVDADALLRLQSKAVKR